jgi:hypothetical protein
MLSLKPNALCERRRVLLGRVGESGRYLHVVFTVPRIQGGVGCYRLSVPVDMTEAEEEAIPPPAY